MAVRIVRYVEIIMHQSSHRVRKVRTAGAQCTQDMSTGSPQPATPRQRRQRSSWRSAVFGTSPRVEPRRFASGGEGAGHAKVCRRAASPSCSTVRRAQRRMLLQRLDEIDQHRVSASQDPLALAGAVVVHARAAFERGVAESSSLSVALPSDRAPVDHVWYHRNDIREHHANDQSHRLQRHVRPDAPPDVRHGDFGRRDPLDIEEVEAERRRQ